MRSPETILRRAFEAAKVPMLAVRVSRYTPEAFGNFVALAETATGRLTITYDRGFFIDADPPVEPRLAARLVILLEKERQTAD